MSVLLFTCQSTHAHGISSVPNYSSSVSSSVPAIAATTAVTAAIITGTIIAIHAIPTNIITLLSMSNTSNSLHYTIICVIFKKVV